MQNALKFTHTRTEVTSSAYAVADCILVDIKDRRGGLPAGDAEKLFLPFAQDSDDKGRLGLGLSIARCSVDQMTGL